MYLRSNDATVDAAEDPERAEFRESVGIPDEAASCHTGMVDGYAVEGHVPAGAIRRLLDDRPDAVGIAVPGMPGDSHSELVETMQTCRLMWTGESGDYLPPSTIGLWRSAQVTDFSPRRRCR